MPILCSCSLLEMSFACVRADTWQAVIMQWQMPVGAEGRGLAGVDRKALGLPTDAEFIAAYCRRRGLKGIDNFGYYLAFCFFRMAAIIQGVLKRALEGNASTPNMG